MVKLMETVACFVVAIEHGGGRREEGKGVLDEGRGSEGGRGVLMSFT